MTVLLIGLGSAGDVHPNVGLAQALKRRGHRVTLVASTVFAPAAERAGVEFHCLGSEKEFYDALQDPDLWHPYRAFSVVARRLILPLMRETYRIIESLSRSGETIVIAPATAFGARIAQEKLGVPLVTAHLQPIMFRSVVAPPSFGFPDIIGHLPRTLRRAYLSAVDRYIVDPLLASEVNAFRTELGLPPVRRVFDRWIHSPQLVLGLFPSWFAPPQPDWPPNVHLTGFLLYDEGDWRPPADGLAEFLEAGAPPIVFTAGSAHAFSAEFFRVSAEACRANRWRGILLTQFPEQVPNPLPDGVRWFDYVPFSTVLPRAAALVHHGGIGTTAQALAAGAPQLVVPFAHDQPDNAVRVRRLGVGDFLLPRRYKAGTVRENVKRLTESVAVGESCRLRARDLAGDAALDRACALIEANSGRNIMYDL